MCDLKSIFNLVCLVVPIDSTAISLQQCQPRKKGKLIRRHQRRNRLKGNRSSYNNLRLKSSGGIGVTPDRHRAPTQLRRSGSFPNRIVIYIIFLPLDAINNHRRTFCKSFYKENKQVRANKSSNKSDTSESIWLGKCLIHKSWFVFSEFELTKQLWCFKLCIFRIFTRKQFI